MTIHQKPYSDACEQNKTPILAVLRTIFKQPGSILEIGAGTGQHAVHFARKLSHLNWQPTDRVENLSGIQLWTTEANLPNLYPPLELDVCHQPWVIEHAEGVFSANTAHIMHPPAVECLFAGVGQLLKPGHAFCLYGPFSYGGHHTSASNAKFNQWLKMRDPLSGVRDFDDLDRLAQKNGLQLLKDYPMPVNNRTLVWIKA